MCMYVYYISINIDLYAGKHLFVKQSENFCELYTYYIQLFWHTWCIHKLVIYSILAAYKHVLKSTNWCVCFRLKLAAIHFNSNADALTTGKEKKYIVAYPKHKKGEPTVKAVSSPADYGMFEV